MALSCHTFSTGGLLAEGDHPSTIVTSVQFEDVPRQVGRRMNVFSDAAGGANAQGGKPVRSVLHQLWSDERGQDIAEYAVMLAVILVIVVGTIRLIGSNANTVFSSVGSAIQ